MRGQLLASKMKKRRFFATLCLAVTSIAGRAQAQSSEGQPWLGDRRFAGGIGIRAGNFELHPGVAGELGYDSNFFQSAGNVTPPGQVVAIDPQYRPVNEDGVSFGDTGIFSEPVVGTLRFRVTPSITLSTLGAQRTEGDSSEAARPKVNLQASASASYNELVATDATYSEAVSENRYLSGDLGVAADIYPDRPWGFNLMGSYNRAVQPVNDPAAPPGFQRSTFQAGAAVAWRPGGGLLEWSLGYNFAYVLFEDAVFSNFSSVANTLSLRGRWMFLPRTALLYAGEYGTLYYPSGGVIKPPGSPLSSQVGINGLVTNHLGAAAMVGYKTIFFGRDAEFDSVVGSAELTWYPLPRPDLEPESAGVGLSSISFGYRRDARPSYLGNYVQNDSLLGRASYFLGGVVLINVEASLDHLSRPASYFSDGTQQSSPFSENRITAMAFAEYRTSDSLGFNTTLRYTSALTDQRIPVENEPSEPELPYDDFAFSRIEAWLGVRWFL
jgi:hypothetical protein